MSGDAGEKSLIVNSPTTTFNQDRPWPWVSYDDPAWHLEPWITSNDEDLADAAVRFAVRYLRITVEGMTILRAAHLVEQATHRVLPDVVAESRTRRFSWGRIAEEFGVGRTAAQKRFGKWPDANRSQELEEQYRSIGDYLYAADRSTDVEAYADWQEALETKQLCIRRRRGSYIDPLDTFKKVVRRRRSKGVNE